MRHRHGRRHWHRGHRHGFGFWGSAWGRSRFFEAGEVRLALLSLLADGPRHGYDLMKELESRSGGMYRASAGTVYPTLQQLEDEGLVVSQTEGGKRVYRLTDAGRRELESESERVGRIWRRAQAWEEWGAATTPEAWEIARPLTRLVKSALAAVSRTGGDPDGVERVREILELTAEELEELGEAGER